MYFNFQDIFRSSFLENVSAIPVFDMVMAMLLSFILGAFIFFIYKKSHMGVMYSAGFGLTIIALCMITALLILAVTSNIVLSLGMVGALSIVRFRTAIKEPSDIAFLFWSIAAGIVLAAGFIPLAVFGSIFIGIVLLLCSNYRGYDRPYSLVLRCKGAEAEKESLSFLKAHAKRLSIKSKTVEQVSDTEHIELDIELRLRDDDTGFINELAGFEGVSHTALVAYNGDYMS